MFKEYRMCLCAILISAIAAAASHYEDKRMDAESVAREAAAPVFNSNYAWLKG